MKIRVQNNTIRFRLNDHEVKELNKGLELTSLTKLPGGNLKFILAKKNAARTYFDNGTIGIMVPAAQVEHWAVSDQVTIPIEYATSDHEKLSIFVEKDIKF